MKVFYKKNNGYLCDRYPYDLKAEEIDPYIEISEEEYNQTLVCELGKSWAVIDGKLTVVDDEETQNSAEYKRIKFENAISVEQEFLTRTDYVIVKLQEAQLEDEEEYQALRLKYADILAKRKQARKSINEWEEELAKLQ